MTAPRKRYGPDPDHPAAKLAVALMEAFDRAIEEGRSTKAVQLGLGLE